MWAAPIPVLISLPAPGFCKVSLWACLSLRDSLKHLAFLGDSFCLQAVEWGEGEPKLCVSSAGGSANRVHWFYFSAHTVVELLVEGAGSSWSARASPAVQPQSCPSRGTRLSGKCNGWWLPLPWKLGRLPRVLRGRGPCFPEARVPSRAASPPHTASRRSARSESFFPPLAVQTECVCHPHCPSRGSETEKLRAVICRARGKSEAAGWRFSYIMESGLCLELRS